MLQKCRNIQTNMQVLEIFNLMGNWYIKRSFVNKQSLPNLERIVRQYMQCAIKKTTLFGKLFQLKDLFFQKRRSSNYSKNRVNYPWKPSLLKGPMIIRNVLLFIGGRWFCYLQRRKNYHQSSIVLLYSGKINFGANVAIFRVSIIL